MTSSTNDNLLLQPMGEHELIMNMGDGEREVIEDVREGERGTEPAEEREVIEDVREGERGTEPGEEREVIEDAGEGGSGIVRENESGQKLGTLANMKLPLPMKVRGRPKGLALTVVGKRKKPRGNQNKTENKRRKILKT